MSNESIPTDYAEFEQNLNQKWQEVCGASPIEDRINKWCPSFYGDYKNPLLLKAARLVYENHLSQLESEDGKKTLHFFVPPSNEDLALEVLKLYIASGSAPDTPMTADEVKEAWQHEGQSVLLCVRDRKTRLVRYKITEEAVAQFARDGTCLIRADDGQRKRHTNRSPDECFCFEDSLAIGDTPPIQFEETILKKQDSPQFFRLKRPLVIIGSKEKQLDAVAKELKRMNLDNIPWSDVFSVLRVKSTPDYVGTKGRLPSVILVPNFRRIRTLSRSHRLIGKMIDNGFNCVVLPGTDSFDEALWPSLRSRFVFHSMEDILLNEGVQNLSGNVFAWNPACENPSSTREKEVLVIQRNDKAAQNMKRLYSLMREFRAFQDDDTASIILDIAWWVVRQLQQPSFDVSRCAELVEKCREEVMRSNLYGESKAMELVDVLSDILQDPLYQTGYTEKWQEIIKQVRSLCQRKQKTTILIASHNKKGIEEGLCEALRQKVAKDFRRVAILRKTDAKGVQNSSSIYFMARRQSHQNDKWFFPDPAEKATWFLYPEEALRFQSMEKKNTHVFHSGPLNVERSSRILGVTLPDPQRHQEVQGASDQAPPSASSLVSLPIMDWDLLFSEGFGIERTAKNEKNDSLISRSLDFVEDEDGRHLCADFTQNATVFREENGKRIPVGIAEVLVGDKLLLLLPLEGVAANGFPRDEEARIEEERGKWITPLTNILMQFGNDVGQVADAINRRGTRFHPPLNIPRDRIRNWIHGDILCPQTAKIIFPIIGELAGDEYLREHGEKLAHSLSKYNHDKSEYGQKVYDQFRTAFAEGQKETRVGDRTFQVDDYFKEVTVKSIREYDDEDELRESMVKGKVNTLKFKDQ